MARCTNTMPREGATVRAQAALSVRVLVGGVENPPTAQVCTHTVHSHVSEDWRRRDCVAVHHVCHREKAGARATEQQVGRAARLTGRQPGFNCPWR